MTDDDIVARCDEIVVVSAQIDTYKNESDNTVSRSS